MFRPTLALAFAALVGGCTFEGGGIAPFNPAPAPVRELDLDVPYVSTPEAVVEAMLDLAEVRDDDMVLDLGSGDGRIAIAAARRGARALGVDIDPNRIIDAQRYAQLAGVDSRVRFRRQDLFQTPLREASVITMYLLPAVNLRLRPRLLTELRPGTRIVSHAFGMDDWSPDAHEVVDGRNVYLWVVPAEVGGDWTLTDADGSVWQLELAQRFQQVSGTLSGNGRTLALSEVTLRGGRLAFTAGGRTYRALVDGAAMAPDPEAGAQPAWRAQRNA